MATPHGKVLNYQPKGARKVWTWWHWALLSLVAVWLVLIIIPVVARLLR